MKPLVGITCNYDPGDTISTHCGVGAPGQDWIFLAKDYVNSVEQAGGIPVLIPQCSAPETLLPLLDRLDALLITGGHDLDPMRYQELPLSACGRVIQARDAQDLFLADYFYRRTDKPMLGICRGLQVLNVALGGSLYQDLTTQGNFHTHRGTWYARNTGWHPVFLTQDSRISEILGCSSVLVNSYHHQAAKAIGHGLSVTGWAEDEVVEALEGNTDRFLLAVQWHPEMMFDNAQQQKIFAAFVQACRTI